MTGLGAARGLPLLCEVTSVSPVIGTGDGRGGCLTVDGGAVEAANRRCHRVDYPELDRPQAARLYCLGVEAFGRRGREALELVRAVARECAAGLPTRVRLGTQTRLLRRWWVLLGLANQRVVARAVTRGTGADLAKCLEETVPGIAGLLA